MRRYRIGGINSVLTTDRLMMNFSTSIIGNKEKHARRQDFVKGAHIQNNFPRCCFTKHNFKKLISQIILYAPKVHAKMPLIFSRNDIEVYRIWISGRKNS